jgi:hypothetical protein
MGVRNNKFKSSVLSLNPFAPVVAVHSVNAIDSRAAGRTSRSVLPGHSLGV